MSNAAGTEPQPFIPALIDQRAGPSCGSIVNLVQIAIIAGAVIETWAIFVLAEREKRAELALALDATLRPLLMMVYVYAVLSLILTAAYGNAALSWVVWGVGLVGLVLFSRRRLVRQLASLGRYRVSLITRLHALGSCDADAQQRERLITKLFHVYDKSGNGQLETAELTDLLRSLYPQLAAEVLHEMMGRSDWLDRNGVTACGVSLEEFCEEIHSWEVQLAPGAAGAAGGAGPASRSAEGAEASIVHAAFASISMPESSAATKWGSSAQVAPSHTKVENVVTGDEQEP